MEMVSIGFWNAKNSVINFTSHWSKHLYALNAAVFIFTIVVSFFLHHPLPFKDLVIKNKDWPKDSKILMNRSDVQINYT